VKIKAKKQVFVISLKNEIEKLCSHKNSKVLLEQIENVIFQALDETERIGTSSFSELTDKTLKGFRLEKKQEVLRVETSASRLASLVVSINQKPEKQKLLKDKQAEFRKLTESLPSLPEEDKIGQDELASLLAVKPSLMIKTLNYKKNLMTFLKLLQK